MDYLELAYICECDIIYNKPQDNLLYRNSYLLALIGANGGNA